MNKELFGIILALLAAIVSGIAIPLNKLFVVDMDPVVFTAVRAVIIGVIFLGISLVTRGFRKEEIGKNWKPLAVIAILGGAFAFLLFFSGLKLTTAGRGAFLQKTLPLYAAVFAFLILKEKIGRRQGLAMLAMLAGAAMILLTGIPAAEMWASPTLGDALIICATVLWALEAVLAKKAMIGSCSNLLVSFSRMFFGGLILFGVVLISGRVGVLFGLSPLQIANILVSTGVLFCYVLLWFAAIRFTEVTKAATLLLIAPVVSLILGFFWFSEPVPLLQLVGSAVILIGAYFAARVESLHAGV
jgi:drug/metabolite transporter (DMT)-like permease